MKSFRNKILSAVLCAVLFLTTVCAAAYKDVQGSWAQKEIDFVSSYGIMQGYQDGNFYPDNAISRAEMIAVALRMLRLDESASGIGYEPSFSDVSEDHWAFGLIEMAVQLDIIHGYPDGTFRPNNLVTYSEAIKILVTLLGYEPAALSKGGYPQGYMTIAMKENIFNLSGVNAQAPASRAAVAVMSYNALQTKMMTSSYYTSAGDVEYTVSDKTMLDIYFNSASGKGIVTATEVEGLYNDPTDEGEIEIDDIVYRCDINYTELLGNKVQFFYKDDGEGKYIVSITKLASSQKTVKLNADMAIDFDGLFTSNGTFAYYRSKNPNKVNTVKISPTVSLIYNNEYISYDNVGTVDFDVMTGTIELIDYDQDNRYDCIKILSYKDYYVNNISQNEETKYITDGTGSSLVYDVEDVYERITMNGSSIEFMDIPKGSIVSAAVSASDNAVEIVICDDFIEGTIETIGESYGRTVVEINSEEYYFSKGAPARYIKSNLNTTGIFRFNAFGEIAYCEMSDDDGEVYGYLCSVYRGQGNGRNVEIEILTEDNRLVVFDVAEKVKLYDQGVESVITAKNFYDKFYHEPAFNDPREALTQVVKYKLNSDGEFSLMRTAVRATRDNPCIDDFSYVETASGQPEGRRYYSNRLFEQRYQITPETVGFKIPWTEGGEQITRYCADVASKMFTSGNYYQVQLFDIDEQNRVGAVMYTIYGQKDVITYEIESRSPLMIVDKVRTVIDEDSGDSYTVISGLVDGEYTSERIAQEYENSISADAKKFGSAIMYETNEDTLKAAYYEGELPGIAVASVQHIPGKSPKRIRWNGGSVEMVSAGIKKTYGTVKSITGFTVNVGDLENVYADGQTITNADYFLQENTRVVIVNLSEEKMDVGTFYDIRPGDDIFIRQRNNTIKDVIVYR